MDDTRRRMIDQCAFYKVESLRALALEALDIKWDKDREGADYFKQVTGRTVAVWARLFERFPTWFDNGHTDYVHATPDGFTALTFLCQLPVDICSELYEAHAEHINEPNAHLLILADVNEHKPTRERNKKTCAACERARELVDRWENQVKYDKGMSKEHRDAWSGAVKELRGALDAKPEPKRKSK